MITASDQAQNVDYTPYEGYRTRGSVTRVYLRGRLAVDQGAMLETAGEFLTRGRNQL